MLRSKSLVLSLLLGCLLVTSACGGGSGNNPPAPPPSGAQTAPVSITIGDTPPAGVTILSFEVTVTQAVLQPGNVQLVSTPIEVEVRRLELESAFLSTINVPAGTYTSIDLTFSNPELTFRNDSGTNLGVPCNRGTSNAGGICEIELSVTRTVSISSNPPFPLTITANTPAGLLIDVNLNNLIQNNLSLDFAAAQAISLIRLQAAQGTGRFDELEDIAGRITAVRAASSEFDLQVFTGSGTRTLTVRTDANTEFDDFDDLGCLTANFACLAVGQAVEVDLELRAGGTLVAEEVEALDADVNNEELEGIVVSTSGLPSSFEIVLLEEIVDVPGLDIGNRVVVNVQAPTRFRIDEDGLSVNNADFDAVSDLLVGQFVEIERISGPTGTPPAVTTDRIKLKDSRFRGTVKAGSVDTVNNTFVVENLPSLFTGQGITELEVRVTPNETEFHNVSGLAALAGGNTVSVRGLLFQGTGTPFVMAKRVRRR